MTETLVAVPIERLEAIERENAQLAESLSDAMLAIKWEDKDWNKLGSFMDGEDIEGFTIEQIQDISKKIRPYLAGGGNLVKRGADLRSGYVWSKGVTIAGTAPATGRGKPTSIRTFYAKSVNQENVFSVLAQSELERAAYSDGNVLLVCSKNGNTVRRLAFGEIKGVKVNPDYPEEIWAYKRTWDPTPNTSRDTMKSMWFYTARFEGRRQKSFTEGGKTTFVSDDTIIDLRLNRQVGWPLGIPDAFAAIVWYQAYIEHMKYGRVVTEGLAKILYKLTGAKTAGGAQDAAIKVASMTGAGKTVSMVEGQDANALNSAGKAYDFVALRPIAAMMAAALNVPNVELLADSAAAGSSYGAAATLTPSTQNAMRTRQDEWKYLFGELFRFFGLGDPSIEFPPISEPDPYREAQRARLFWDSGVLHVDEYREEALHQLKMPPKHDSAPDGIMLPNNEFSMNRRDIDPNTSGSGGSTTASPNQGQANGTGGDSNAGNDIRTDLISQSFANNIDMDRLEELAIRLENAVGSILVNGA